MKRRQPPTAGQEAPTTDEIAAAFATLLRAVGRQPEPSDGRIEPLMTPGEAARWARVSEDTLERWRSLGMRSYGEGRIRRYRASDVLAFLAELDHPVAAERNELDSIEQRARLAAQKVNEVMRGIDSQAHGA